MTEIEKKKILMFRSVGIGYGTIAKTLNISENTVKSFCRRNKDKDGRRFCFHCGKEIPKTGAWKRKKFCSDECCMAWWNSHREEVKHRVVQELECQHCHKQFKVYGNRKAKFCSHSCYIADRFGGRNEEKRISE